MGKIRDVLTEERRILVFEDDETYTGDGSDSRIVWLTEEGEKEMSDGTEFHNLGDGMVRGNLSIKDLLDCWMEKYGSEEWLGD